MPVSVKRGIPGRLPAGTAIGGENFFSEDSIWGSGSTDKVMGTKGHDNWTSVDYSKWEKYGWTKAIPIEGVGNNRITLRLMIGAFDPMMAFAKTYAIKNEVLPYMLKNIKE